MSYAPDGVPVEAGGVEDRLLPWARVRDIAGISRSTAWRMQQNGAFPTPVEVSPGRVGWWESELTAWKARRTSAAERPRVLKAPRQSRLAGTAPRARASAPTSPAPAVTEPSRSMKRSVRPRAAPPEQIDFGF